MKLGMYSLFDKLTCYDYPFPAASDAAAVRQFEQIINGNEVCKAHPGDYDLYKVGEFDNMTGMVDVCQPNEFISTGVNVLWRDKDVSEQSA